MNKTKEQEFLIQNVIAEVASYIAEDWNVTAAQALNIFISSELSRKIEDVETGYYWESPGYVYEIFKKEYLRQ